MKDASGHAGIPDSNREISCSNTLLLLWDQRTGSKRTAHWGLINIRGLSREYPAPQRKCCLRAFCSVLSIFWRTMIITPSGTKHLILTFRDRVRFFIYFVLTNDLFNCLWSARATLQDERMWVFWIIHWFKATPAMCFPPVWCCVANACKIIFSERSISGVSSNDLVLFYIKNCLVWKFLSRGRETTGYDLPARAEIYNARLPRKVQVKVSQDSSQPPTAFLIFSLLHKAGKHLEMDDQISEKHISWSCPLPVPP